MSTRWCKLSVKYTNHKIYQSNVFYTQDQTRMNERHPTRHSSGQNVALRLLIGLSQHRDGYCCDREAGNIPSTIEKKM